MGTVLGGRYELTQEIAQGAIGSVWQALDRDTGDVVAVKLLHEKAADQPDLAAGFIAEGKILAQFDHPSIVRYRDFLSVDGQYALVLDLIDGEDLRRRLRRTGPVPPAVAVDLVAQLADALSYLHARGVVHGDVKPGNLVVPADGSPVRLVDFGSAHAADLDEEGERAVHATPEYVAPEVVAGVRPTAASDVYALGVLLFELLCGRSPYRGGSSMEVLGRHGTCRPVPPPGLPPVVWPMIEECMALDPAQRPQAQLVAARLRGMEPALDGVSSLPELSADQVTWWPRPDRAATAVARVRQQVRWVPLRTAPVPQAGAYAGPMVAVPIPMAIVGFEPVPDASQPVSLASVLRPGSAGHWPSGTRPNPAKPAVPPAVDRPATHPPALAAMTSTVREPAPKPQVGPVPVTAAPGAVKTTAQEPTVDLAGPTAGLTPVTSRRRIPPVMIGGGAVAAAVVGLLLALPLFGGGPIGDRPTGKREPLPAVTTPSTAPTVEILAPTDPATAGVAMNPKTTSTTDGEPAADPEFSVSPSVFGTPVVGPGIGQPLPGMPTLWPARPSQQNR